jgi:hypothetical protein
MDDAVWVPTVFTKNRDRLLEGDVAEKFSQLVLTQARAADLLVGPGATPKPANSVRVPP